MIVKNKINTNRLTIAKEYEVISIGIKLNTHKTDFEIWTRVLDDVGVPVLFLITDFDIVDASNRSSWCMQFVEGYIEILPKTFTYASFWEDFFDDVPEAVDIFLNEFPEFRNRGMMW